MTAHKLDNSGDVVEMLKEQHAQIKSLFDSALTSDTDETRKQAFDELRRVLAIHETAEEEVVHPAAREIPYGDKIVEERLKEENEAKHALKALEELDVDSQKFTEKLKELQTNVVAHAEHEEQEEFAKLQEEMTHASLARMRVAAHLAETTAPTFPHPGVESRSANLLVGPFAAMVDRVRDALAK